MKEAGRTEDHLTPGCAEETGQDGGEDEGWGMGMSLLKMGRLMLECYLEPMILRLPKKKGGRYSCQDHKSG